MSVKALTASQLGWLASCIETFTHGPEACTGRGQRAVADALERRGLVAVLDHRATNGEDLPTEVSITVDGIRYLHGRIDELSSLDQRKLLRTMADDDRTSDLVVRAAVSSLRAPSIVRTREEIEAALREHDEQSYSDDWCRSEIIASTLRWVLGKARTL